MLLSKTGLRMKITENVDLPLELIEAQESGNLVLFVGAGASISPPARLMGFFDLAKKLGNDARSNQPTEAEPLDQYLGALANKGFDVHRHARAALNRTDSQPNDTHKAIIDLALSSKHPRIITTNFDALLGEACKLTGTELQQWVGPALPLGDDFSGIVQIHGTLDPNEQQMVLTDADFGQAYVTRSWASRFLTEVFSHFTVLFIGYSHRDPIMRYFSHGLPRNTSRFALLGHEKESDFQDSKSLMEGFGITVIEYPALNGHEALPKALSEWARLSCLDKLGVRKEIEEILINFDNATPAEKDFLSRQVKTNEGIKNFSSIALKLSESKQDAVYQWVRECDVFKQLFERTRNTAEFSEDSLCSLAEWSARFFTRDPETNYEFWRCHWEFGALLHEEFSRLLLSYASEAAQNSVDGDRTLITYLRTSLPGITAPLPADSRKLLDDEWKILSGAELSRLVEARAVVDSFTFKYPELGRKLITFTPEWDLELAQLETGLSQLKIDSMLSMSAITRILVNSIYRIDALLIALNSGEHYDTLSSYRPSIKGVEHAYSDTPINPIVDFIVEFARTNGADRIAIKELVESGVILLERIAIYIVSFAQEISATKKLKWLMEHQQLIISRTHFPEVRELLLQVMAEAAAHERGEFLSFLRDEFSQDLDEFKSLGIYKVLLAAKERCEFWKEAENFKADIERVFPSFQNLTLSDTDNFRSADDLSYAAVLVDKIEQGLDINDVLEGFFSQVKKDSFYASQMIRKESESLVLKSPKLAMDMALEASKSERNSFTESFVSSVLSSIDSASYSELTNELKLLSDSLTGHLSLTALARAIHKASENELGAREIQDLEQSIDSIWVRNRHRFNKEFQTDLRFTSYLNDWPGILVTATGRLIYSEWKTSREQWTGLPQDSRDRLKRFLDEAGPASSVVAQSFSASLRFFLSADEDFANENLISLFEKNESTKLGAWVGFLAQPFYAVDYPIAGAILSLLYEGWNFISEHQANRELSESFFKLITIVISKGPYPPETVSDLLLSNITKLPEPLMEALYLKIGSELSGANGQNIWSNGVEEFIQARVNGIPRGMNLAERDALYKLPFIAPNLAIELFSVIGDTSALAIEKVPDSSIIANSPETVKKLLVDAYINRLTENGIEPKIAAAWKRGLERLNSNESISPEIGRLIAKLEDAV